MNATPTGSADRRSGSQLRAEILAFLASAGPSPARDESLRNLAEAVRDVTDHDHQREDLYCDNLIGWMGERMGPSCAAWSTRRPRTSSCAAPWRGWRRRAPDRVAAERAPRKRRPRPRLAPARTRHRGMTPPPWLTRRKHMPQRELDERAVHNNVRSNPLPVQVLNVEAGQALVLVEGTGARLRYGDILTVNAAALRDKKEG